MRMRRKRGCSLTNLTGRPALGQKATKPIRGTDAAKAHMARVAAMSCVLCQSRPVEVHHCISGRYGSRKVSDFDTIPLCCDHHRGGNGIHTDKGLWEAAYGKDTDYLPVVARMIGGSNELA